MKRERKVPTKGSAFCRILDKCSLWDDTDAVKAAREWQMALMVYNLAKQKEGFTKPPGFGLPGGGVMTIETPVQGMLRELFEETGRVFNVGNKFLLDSLNSLTNEIERRADGSDYLRRAVESRINLIKEYAEMAEEKGLIRLVRTEEEKKPPVWIFEADSQDLFPRENAPNPESFVEFEGASGYRLRGCKELRANSRNDLAKNTEFAMWISREQLTDVAENFKYYASSDKSRVYSGHLRRLDLDVRH